MPAIRLETRRVILCFTAMKPLFQDLCEQMEKFSCTSRRSLILNTKILVFFLVSVAAQPGFLNIDCGGKSNSIDAATNLSWITDTNYVDIGETANVSLSNVSHHLRSLRFFPKPLKKSCYRLPVKPNVTYLLRLWFLSGNHNEAQKLPSFNVSFETQGMLSQKIQSIGYAEKIEWTSEKILTSINTVLYVCFIRTSDDSDPFVSAIQLRSLLSGMYAHKPRTMLSSLARYDILAETSALEPCRYPQDPFDRFWKREPFYIDEKNNIEYRRSEKMVANNYTDTNFPPPVVMQTAMIAKPNTGPLRILLQGVESRTLAVLYFAEIEVLNASESRKFKILINEKFVRNISFAEENYSIEVPILYNDTGEVVVVSLETIQEQGKSSRGPLINAFEYYRIIDSDLETDAHDVDALLGIKRAFASRLKHWISDPCFGIEWDGIRCTKSHSVRVVELDLSGRGLSGSLPNFCSLTKLQILRLQNNNFSGTIPDCLSQLNFLEELNLENNSFNGVLPKGLLQKRFLDLRYSGNPYLCMDNYQCHSQKKKVRIVALSTTGTLLAFLLVLLLVILYHRRSKLKKQNQKNTNQTLSIKVPNPTSCGSFNLETMKSATQNFNQKLGQEGFGSVYFGKLQDRKDVTGVSVLR